MKILLINSHHSPNGGTERYYFGLGKILTGKGHKVAYFSMKGKDNLDTPWSKYFVSNVDFTKNDLRSFLKKIARMFYSIESRLAIRKLLDKFKPDIVHINNIYYYISPSILGEISKRKIPIVQTVHDYELISPNLILFYKGKICEITKKHNYYKAFFDRSIKGSYVASIMAVIVSYIQYIFRFHEKYISVFITPSMFVKRKLEQYDFKAKQIQHLPNFVEKPSFNKKSNNTKGRKKFFLFFGRLTEHKGVITILKTAQMLPNINFKLIGGFADNKTKNAIDRYLKSNKNKNLELIDYQDPKDLNVNIAKSVAVVVPSIWYENQPYSIMESYVLGKPVIASRIGGIPEIVIDGETGLLFRPDDAKDLADKILKLWRNPKLATKMGKNATNYANKYFSPAGYYKKIISIYKSQIKK